MKLYTTAVAMFLLVSSSVAFSANSSGPGAASPAAANPQPETPLLEQNMFGNSQPGIAGDGIQNATQVDSPSDIGNKSSTAQDSPEPVPTEGDVGVQNAK